MKSAKKRLSLHTVNSTITEAKHLLQCYRNATKEDFIWRDNATRIIAGAWRPSEMNFQEWFWDSLPWFHFKNRRFFLKKSQTHKRNASSNSRTVRPNSSELRGSSERPMHRSSNEHWRNKELWPSWILQRSPMSCFWPSVHMRRQKYRRTERKKSLQRLFRRKVITTFWFVNSWLQFLSAMFVLLNKWIPL